MSVTNWAHEGSLALTLHPFSPAPHPEERRRDTSLALLAALLVLAGCLATMAPSVQPGDIAELQRIPSQMGILYPNGWPFYLFLDKVWSSLFVGSLAWRRQGLCCLFPLAALLAGLGLASHPASLLFMVPAAVLFLWPGPPRRVPPCGSRP